VRNLQRLQPICSECKKVRNDSEYWQEIDAYSRDQTGTRLARGICPTCVASFLQRALPYDPVAQPNPPA
jgi:hypothetical protein